MLTEKCIRVMNKIALPTSESDDEVRCECRRNAARLYHPICYEIIPKIYLSNSDQWTPEKLRAHQFTHLIASTRGGFEHMNSANSLDPIEFEILDLNFAETPFTTTVLPNIYKSVRFIEKALTNSGKVLVAEMDGNQKCFTVVIAYIMYRFRLKFVESLQILHRFCTTLPVELDRFLVAQLLEYEPILEVQRRAQLGSSCSSELRSAHLKRKKTFDEDCSSALKAADSMET